jgi:hypothetical protein
MRDNYAYLEGYKLMNQLIWASASGEANKGKVDELVLWEVRLILVVVHPTNQKITHNTSCTYSTLKPLSPLILKRRGP